MRLGVLGDGQGLVGRFVVDGEAAAEVEPFDLVAALCQAVDQLDHFGDGVDVGLDLIDRRADVHMHAGDAQVFEIAVLLEDALGAFDIDAELGFLFAGGGFGVRARIDIGIDAQRADGFLADLAGDAIDVFDLGFGFEIERGDADVDAVGDFLIGLADAGVDDLLRIAAGLKRAEEFAAAGDVKAASFVARGNCRMLMLPQLLME